MNKKDLHSKEPREGELKILDALKDKPGITATELMLLLKRRDFTKLSKPSLYENLKRLYARGMITYDLLTKGYSICTEGRNYLKRNNMERAIKTGTLETSNEPPVESIAGFNIPEMSREQQNTLNAGTPKIADVVFRQFSSDMKTNAEKFPAAGVIVYTVSIDLGKAKEFLDSDEGKKYVKVCTR